MESIKLKEETTENQQVTDEQGEEGAVAASPRVEQETSGASCKEKEKMPHLDTFVPEKELEYLPREDANSDNPALCEGQGACVIVTPQRMFELKRKIEVKQERNEELEKTRLLVKQHECKIREMETEIDELKNEVKEGIKDVALKERNVALCKENTALKDKIEFLIKQRDEEVKELRKAQRHCQSLKNEIEELTSQISQLKKNIEYLMQEREEDKASISQLREDIKRGQEEQAQLTREMLEQLKQLTHRNVNESNSNSNINNNFDKNSKV